MRIDVRFSLEGVADSDLSGATVVIVDVIRATTCVVEALAAGARGIYPTGSTEEAVKLLQSLGRDDTLLCGERKGIKIEGYDLGNSPREFTPEVVGGKRLIMNTSNGTPAFVAVDGAERVLAAAFSNLGAVSEVVARSDRIVVVCAGGSGAFALEDALCAGHLVRRLRAAGIEPLELGDGGRAAETLADRFAVDAETLAGTDAAGMLAEIGLGDDIADCARLDVHRVVPELDDRVLRSRHGA